MLVAASVFLLDLFVPPTLLSLTRKPVDFFTFNPWLPNLPKYLLSGRAPLAERIEKARNLALFWFSADNPYGVEWGFAVTATRPEGVGAVAVNCGQIPRNLAPLRGAGPIVVPWARSRIWPAGDPAR